jgi:peptide-methionine (R)-S-oxide reductase
MNRRFFISSSIAAGGFAMLSRVANCAQPNERMLRGVLAVNPHSNPLSERDGTNAQEKSKSKGIQKVIKTDAEWKAQLTPEQYSVLRQEGTEYAFTSPLNDIHDKGIFECVGCELPVFSSAQKFDSGTGWPSFWAPIKNESIIEAVDKSLGITRTKVSCARCEGHLGHVFDDGPKPTGLRYCMNGVALRFVKEQAKSQ